MVKLWAWRWEMGLGSLSAQGSVDSSDYKLVISLGEMSAGVLWEHSTVILCDPRVYLREHSSIFLSEKQNIPKYSIGLTKARLHFHYCSL